MSLASLYINQIQQSGIGMALLQPPPTPTPGTPNQPAAGIKIFDTLPHLLLFSHK